MPLEIDHRPLDALRPYAKNPRTHSATQIRQIEASLLRFGWCTPMGMADGVLIYGHARLQAALNLRKRNATIPNAADQDTGPVVDLSHLSSDERRAYVIADNQLALQAGWDEALLSVEVKDLSLGGFDLSLIGFSAKELTSLLSPADAGRGDLLDVMQITIADPRHAVTHGDHWKLADRHHLVCVSVIEDWQVWKPLLKAGTLFVPYPGPFVPFGTKADECALVMVQPDEYAAGHILDRYADAHGDDAVRKL